MLAHLECMVVPSGVYSFLYFHLLVNGYHVFQSTYGSKLSHPSSIFAQSSFLDFFKYKTNSANIVTKNDEIQVLLDYASKEN